MAAMGIVWRLPAVAGTTIGEWQEEVGTWWMRGRVIRLGFYIYIYSMYACMYLSILSFLSLLWHTRYLVVKYDLCVLLVALILRKLKCLSTSAREYQNKQCTYPCRTFHYVLRLDKFWKYQTIHVPYSVNFAINIQLSSGTCEVMI